MKTLLQVCHLAAVSVPPKAPIALILMMSCIVDLSMATLEILEEEKAHCTKFFTVIDQNTTTGYSGD